MNTSDQYEIQENEQEPQAGHWLADIWLPVVASVGLVIVVLLVGVYIFRQAQSESSDTEATPEKCALESFRPLLSSPPAQGTAKIVSPPHCRTNLQREPAPIDARGTYSPELENKALWLLVYSPEGLYYPQAIDRCAPVIMDKADGVWQTYAYLSHNAYGQQFELVLVAVDPNSEADRYFYQWMRDACDDLYRGLNHAQLPAGVTEMDSITVQASK